MKEKRRKFTSAFKTKVVLEALKERTTLSELSQKYEVHPNIIGKWKTEFLENASLVFDKNNKKESTNTEHDELYKEIGKMKIENDWLKKKLGPFL